MWLRRGVLAMLVTAGCGTSEKLTSPPADPNACPMPLPPGVTERFAVGAVPSHRIRDLLGHGTKCWLDFAPSKVVALRAGEPVLVAPGTFQGRCPGSAATHDFEAVTAAKLVVAINSTHVSLGGELGAGKPARLASAPPEHMVRVVVYPVDRCGTQLDGGHGRTGATWRPIGCDNIAKLVPWDDDPHAAGGAMRIAALGPGTCNVTVEMYGARGEVDVIVK